ncbi:hypothetical protein GGR50DRAFT_487974 [Xylaria sp. CBS 124048]|nr:hypothetical protein GGR50DRAFT_487974 [Xylaria sp. CBS 124048]
MAAISTAPGPSSFPPPSDLQDEYAGWGRIPNGHNETPSHSSTDYEAIDSSPSVPNALQNGAPDSYFGPEVSPSTSHTHSQTKHSKDDSAPGDDEVTSSGWIHRDKLAKIESEELQAAGITLPKPRTQSRARRDRSHSRRRGTLDSSDQQHPPKARKNPESNDKPPESEYSSWDLRRPEEIAEDPGEYWVSNESGKGTRIPVAKTSPAPIPTDYIDRNSPAQRKSSGSKSGGSLADDDTTSISYPKSRSRSNSSANALDDSSLKGPSGKRTATDGSPKKSPTNGPRKASATAKQNPQGRPKTRSGTTTRSGSATRPTTRSGELSATKAPEGDPPWMISAYQPDPRLPPDQQLLPTVARRLQQEKWEQEGALGSVFDKEFRPLNKGNFATPPDVEKPQEPEEPEANQKEWPLKHEAAASTTNPPEPASPTPTRPSVVTANSYSTMPKIHDVPAVNPLGGSKPVSQTQASATVRVPDPPEPEKNDTAGCGCCTVM